jgi:hypothetical protein
MEVSNKAAIFIMAYPAFAFRRMELARIKRQFSASDPTPKWVSLNKSERREQMAGKAQWNFRNASFHQQAAVTVPVL